MSINLEKLLDRTGRMILRELQENARLPFSEIGRRVGLSTPAVAERVRRLEEAGVITGYRADVDAQRLGYPLTVFVRLYTTPDRYPYVSELVRSIPEVLECYHVTGEESFVIKLVAPSVGRLEAIIQRFSPYGKTATSVVLSTPVGPRVMETTGPVQSSAGRPGPVKASGEQQGP